MSSELWLFLIIGAISVIAAVMMLLSENAIHSALFLILNLVSVAFLFLLLEAPFLALIQITVYAGAIMVLFLFVIMLLGAERVSGETAAQPYPWMTPLAVLLAAAFLAAAGTGIARGDIALQVPAGNQPLLRVAHVVPGIAAADVAVDGTPVAMDIAFGSVSEFIELDPGEHRVTLSAPDSGDALFEAGITLDANDVYTAVAFNLDGAPTLRAVPQDISVVEDRSESRFTVFNAFSEAPAVNLIDLGGNQVLDTDTTTGEITDRFILTGLAPGGASEPFHYEEGTAYWFFTTADGNDVLYRLRDFTLERGQSQLLVLAAEPVLDGTLRAVALPFPVAAHDSFGGPQAIGELLFSAYLLPFELVSVLLLVAMVGAILLTQKVSVPAAERRKPVRRRVSRPLTSVIAAQTGRQTLAAPPENDTSSAAQPEAAGD